MTKREKLARVLRREFDQCWSSLRAFEDIPEAYRTYYLEAADSVIANMNDPAWNDTQPAA